MFLLCTGRVLEQCRLELCFGAQKKKRTKVKPLAGVWRVSLQCRLHLSENKMSATSIPERSLGSGQVWLADVTLGSDVISCRSHNVEKGYLAFFWARAGGGGVSGLAAGLRNAVSPVWRTWLGCGRAASGEDTGTSVVSWDFAPSLCSWWPTGVPRGCIPQPFPLHMQDKAYFAGLQEPVLFPHLALVPGITQLLNTDASPRLGER